MIPQQTPVKNHFGNNSNTSFDFDFYIEKEEQLLVTHTDFDGNITTPQLGVDYSITSVGNMDGSSITFPIAGSSYSVLGWDTSTNKKELLSISLNIPIEQPAEYSMSGDLNKKNLEKSFDYLTRLVQLLSRKIDRAVKVDEGSPVDTAQLVLNINTAIEHLSNIDTVALDRANIDAVAGNATNINTVAGSISNVNKVGTDIANVNNIATDLNLGNDSEIKKVNANKTNINTVAAIDDDVTTVAGIHLAVSAVADNETNINAVNANKDNIDIVADDIANVNAVRTDIANINTVAAIDDDVTTVAGIHSAVSAVADNETNINAVNANKANIDIVADDKANIDIVAGDKANIDIVAGDKANIDIAAAHASNIDTAATHITNIDTCATNIIDINTVAGIDDYVVDVSANESNITTVATNIEDVQNAANLIETVYSVLNGGTASSQFTEGVSGGDASSTFTTRITGGNGRSVGTIIGDIQSNIRVIELNQRNDETNIAHLRADLTTETNERITTDISLQGQIDDINDEIILINQNADSLDGRITTNTDDITDAFNQIHSNDDDIAAIQLVNASQSLDISYLQSDVTTLKAEAKEVYSILSGGTASSSFTESVSGGDAATSFTSKIIGGSASSVGSLLADAYNLIRTLTSRLSEAFNEIALLKNKDIDLQSEINAINSITGISGGTASSVFS